MHVNQETVASLQSSKQTRREIVTKNRKLIATQTIKSSATFSKHIKLHWICLSSLIFQVIAKEILARTGKHIYLSTIEFEMNELRNRYEAQTVCRSSSLKFLGVTNAPTSGSAYFSTIEFETNESRNSHKEQTNDGITQAKIFTIKLNLYRILQRPGASLMQNEILHNKRFLTKLSSL